MDKRYLQFPIMLIREVHINYDQAMQRIISFAIVDYALKQKVSNEDAARQALYSYYRGNGLKELYNTVDAYMIDNKVQYDEDYNGFTGNSFNPEDSINDVLQLFEHDKNFYDLAIKNCQLSKIDEFFGITGVSNETRLTEYDNIKNQVSKHEQEFGAEPMPTIEKDLFFDFWDQPDPIVFCAYVAIKSLQGLKNFVATTRNVVLMRMMGAKSKKALKEHLNDEEIENIYTKFSRSENALRYHFNKLFDSLLRRGLLKSKIFERSISRKIFLSTRLDYNELANKIIEQANKKDHKTKEHEAIKKIRDAKK